MYSVSNSDIARIAELLRRAGDSTCACGSDKAANFRRVAVRLADKLARKKPEKEESYAVVIRKEQDGADTSELDRALEALPPGTYGVTLKKCRRARTDLQNRYLWGVVYPSVLQGLHDAGWDDITSTEEVHAFCKARIGSRTAVNRDTGEAIDIPVSTTIMDTAQMTAYIDRIRAFAEEYLNTYIPEPK